jgi:HD-GYP domain-containing protein (c-di-GMP phosphodiesterase class II)
MTKSMASELDALGAWDPEKARELIRTLLVQTHKQRVLIELAKLSGSEFDLIKLLEIIARKSTEVVDADRAAVFLVDYKRNRLWTIVAEGLEDQSIITLPMGTGIVGYAVSQARQVIIDDAYNDPRFDKTTDLRTGYRTTNIAATPMVSRSGRVLGVLEVMNKKDGAFTHEDADFMLAFAGAAANHVETATLYREMETLFEGFINTVAAAVDERDPCTAGHSRRVKVYSRAMGEEVNRVDGGPLASIWFTPDDIRQLEIAALMHDVGKVGVRDSVLNKRNRLTDDALRVVTQRIDLILSKMKLDHALEGKPLAPEEEAVVQDAIQFIQRLSAAGFLSTDDAKRLWSIRELGWLDDCEYEHLAVTRGNLTPAEWEHMQSHVTKSQQLLARIPWPEKLSRVPEIAYCHHEKLNGKGYPRGIAAPQIPIEAQIVTVADIYDALTAHDRPYKPPMPHEKAASILREQAKENFLNNDLVELFLGQKLYAIKD